MGVKRRLLWEIRAMKSLFLALALGAGLLTSLGCACRGDRGRPCRPLA